MAMLILALALSGCGGGSGSGKRDGPVTYPAKIVFVSDRGYDPQTPPISPLGLNIFSMNYDGSDLKQLTTDTDGTNYCRPELSPDNSKVVYVKMLPAGGKIEGLWVMNADGTGKNRIYTPSSNTWSIYPSWTPDGKIIFCNTNERKVYLTTANGTIVAQITFNIIESPLRVSPDGKKILTNLDSQIDIWDFDGASISHHTMVCSLGDFSVPSWSLDGAKIIFAGNRTTDGGYGIFSINAAGPLFGFTPENNINNAARLTNCTESYGVNPVFSRDGAKIIFTDTGSNGDYEIFSINSDGGGKTNLTNNAAYDSFYDYD